MDIMTINTFEDIHHTCLMYGLKKAWLRFPFLVRNPLATPPPIRRNPQRPLLNIGGRFNPVNVQYYGKDIRILYEKERNTEEELIAFAKAVLEEYFNLRHPFMKYVEEGMEFRESSSMHVIARITVQGRGGQSDSQKD